VVHGPNARQKFGEFSPGRRMGNRTVTLALNRAEASRAPDPQMSSHPPAIGDETKDADFGLYTGNASNRILTIP